MLCSRPFLGSLFPESEYLRTLHQRTSRAGIETVSHQLKVFATFAVSPEICQNSRIFFLDNILFPHFRWQSRQRGALTFWQQGE